MNTLEVACAACDKRFRVRSEFAGKSTRCPGCSAPMTIGTAPRPVATREESAERPRPRPRRRDDEDEEPRRSAANWKPVDLALAREQVAILFVLLIYVTTLMSVILGFAMGPFGPDVIVKVIMVFLMVGPALIAGVFAISARATALRAPAECHSKSATVSSLLCAFGALASLIMFGISVVMAFDQGRPPELAMEVGIGGAVLGSLFAAATFVGFATQVGIARKSSEVARAVGRTAVTACICLLGMMAIAFVYVIVTEFDGSNSSYYGYYREDQPFYFVMVGILTPISIALLLIFYHRLLAATRRSIRGDAERRYDD